MSRDAPTLEVRPATAADLPALETLERQGFSDPWSRALLAGELRQPGSLVLVAIEAGELVGYASFRRAADEAELLRVAVSPGRRDRGIGRRLVREGLDRLARSGVARCFLEVRPRNAPARALYGRLGFHEAGLRRAYYPDGCDALILSLPLCGAPAAGSQDARDLPAEPASGSLDRSPTG